MSNHKSDEISDRRKSKVSSAMEISGGLGGPKAILCFGVGEPMDSRLIFRPPSRIFLRVTESSSLGKLLDSCFQHKEKSKCWENYSLWGIRSK